MMRALRRSKSTPNVSPTPFSRLRDFFGLGRRRAIPKVQETGRTTSSSTAAPSQLPSVAPRLPEFTPSDAISGSECTVCRSESNGGEATLKIPTEACNHPPQVCIGCLQQVILAAVTSGDFVSGVMCPSYGCVQRLGYHDVRKWASKEVFERYDKLILRDSLRNDGRYVFCVNPSCTAGQEHTGGENNNIVTCYQCGTKQCLRHQILWHEGLNCEQWDDHHRTITNQQENKTEVWIQTGTKPCPGPGCGRRIQKIDGCNHMTCKRPGGCGHQFCWECLAPWRQIISGDNSRHYDNCKYYSGSPGKNPAPPEPVAARAARAQPTVLAIQAPISPATSTAALGSSSTGLRRRSGLIIEGGLWSNTGRPTPAPSDGPTPTSLRPVAGGSTNQSPPVSITPSSPFLEYNTRLQTAEAQRLQRERKQYEASRVQFQQQRISRFETQLAFERTEENQVPFPLNPTRWLDPISPYPQDPADLFLLTPPNPSFGDPTPTTTQRIEEKAAETRRRNAEAQKLYRERKKRYEAELLSRVQFQQERINQLEAQLAFERAQKQNQASLPLGPGWLDQIPPYPRDVAVLFQDPRPILPFNQ